jgi:hypothetical protein
MDREDDLVGLPVEDQVGSHLGVSQVLPCAADQCVIPPRRGNRGRVERLGMANSIAVEQSEAAGQV